MCRRAPNVEVSRRLRERRDRGSLSLELAVVGPVLILLIFFAIQASLYYYARSVALSAAREGVSQLRVVPDRPSYEQIDSRVLVSTEQYAGKIGGQALLRPNATSEFHDDSGTVTVTVTGHVVSLVPFDMTVTQQASGSVERFRAP